MQAYALILKKSQEDEGWSTGKLVLKQPKRLQFRQLAQFSRNGTWGYTNPSQNIQKTSHPIRLLRFDCGTQAYAVILKASQGGEGLSTGKLVFV